MGKAYESLGAPLTEWEKTHWAWSDDGIPGREVQFWRSICPRVIDHREANVSTSRVHHIYMNILLELLSSGINNVSKHAYIPMRKAVDNKLRKYGCKKVYMKTRKDAKWAAIYPKYPKAARR